MTSVRYPDSHNFKRFFVGSGEQTVDWCGFDSMGRPNRLTNDLETEVSGGTYGPANQMIGMTWGSIRQAKKQRLQLTWNLAS